MMSSYFKSSAPAKIAASESVSRAAIAPESVSAHEYKSSAASVAATPSVVTRGPRFVRGVPVPQVDNFVLTGDGPCDVSEPCAHSEFSRPTHPGSSGKAAPPSLPEVVSPASPAGVRHVQVDRFIVCPELKQQLILIKGLLGSGIAIANTPTLDEHQLFVFKQIICRINEVVGDVMDMEFSRCVPAPKDEVTLALFKSSNSTWSFPQVVRRLGNDLDALPVGKSMACCECGLSAIFDGSLLWSLCKHVRYISISGSVGSAVHNLPCEYQPFHLKQATSPPLQVGPSLEVKKQCFSGSVVQVPKRDYPCPGFVQGCLSCEAALIQHDGWVFSYQSLQTGFERSMVGDYINNLKAFCDSPCMHYSYLHDNLVTKKEGEPVMRIRVKKQMMKDDGEDKKHLEVKAEVVKTEVLSAAKNGAAPSSLGSAKAPSRPERPCVPEEIDEDDVEEITHESCLRTCARSVVSGLSKVVGKFGSVLKYALNYVKNLVGDFCVDGIVESVRARWRKLNHEGRLGKKLKIFLAIMVGAILIRYREYIYVFVEAMRAALGRLCDFMKSLPTFLSSVFEIVRSAAVEPRAAMVALISILHVKEMKPLSVLKVATSVVSGCIAVRSIFDFIARLLPECVIRAVYALTGFSLTGTPPHVKYAMREAARVICAYKESDPINDVDKVLANDLITVSKIMVEQKTIGCIPSHMRGNYESLYKDLTLFHDKATVALGRHALRQEPVGVYIYGTPGVGKSGFFSSFLPGFLYPDLPLDEAYVSVNPADPFASNYACQRIYAIDDWGASMDEKALNANILRIVSPSFFGLNMAAVVDKGKPFNSEFVVVTTNRKPDANIDGLVSSKPFWRRFIILRISVRPECCKNGTDQLDPEKARPDMSHLNFGMQTTKDGPVVGCDATYVCQFLANMRQKKRCEYLARLACVDVARSLGRASAASQPASVDVKVPHMEVIDGKVDYSQQRRRTACPDCGAAYHGDTACTTRVKCYNCGGRGHTAAVCVKNRAIDPPVRRTFAEVAENLPVAKQMYRFTTRDASGHVIPPEICDDPYVVFDGHSYMAQGTATGITFEPYDISADYVDCGTPYKMRLTETQLHFLHALDPKAIVPILTKSTVEGAFCHAHSCAGEVGEFDLFCDYHAGYGNIVEHLFRGFDMSVSQVRPRVSCYQDWYRNYVSSKPSTKVVAFLKSALKIISVISAFVMVYEFFKPKGKESETIVVEKQGFHYPYPASEKEWQHLFEIYGYDPSQWTNKDMRAKVLDARDGGEFNPKNMRKLGSLGPQYDNQRGYATEDGSFDAYLLAKRGRGTYVKQAWTVPLSKPEGELAKVQRAIVTITDKSKNWSCHGVRVVGSYIAMPAHFFDSYPAGFIEEDTILTLDSHSWANVPYSFSSQYVEFNKDGDNYTDLAVLDGRFTTPIGFKSDTILSLMVSKSELDTLSTCSGLLVGRTDTRPISLILKRTRVSYEADGKFNMFFLPVFWQYEAQSDGDCGKAIFALINGSWRVVGFHVASTLHEDSYGVGVVLVKEMFEHKKDISLMGLPRFGKPVDFGCNMRSVSTVPERRINEPYQKASPLLFQKQAWFPKEFGTFVPSVISRHNMVNPGHSVFEVMETSLIKLQKADLIPFPESRARDCVHDIFAKFDTIAPAMVVRKLTEQEALNGFKGLEPIDLRTSAGHPWAMLKLQDMESRHLKGKSFLFSRREDGTIEISDDRLVKAIQLQDEFLRKGLVYPWFWSVVPKDELRPIEKVSVPETGEYSTRLIENPPVELTILFRQYFGSFISFIISHPLVFGIAVGMNPYSQDWDAMIRMLLANSPIGFPGDYSKFDSTMAAQQAKLYCDGINNWYRVHGEVVGEEFASDCIARESLMYVLIYFMSLAGVDVIQVWWMHPSGSFLTTILNCIHNLFLIRVVYLHLALEHSPGLANMRAFNSLVRPMVYGDDMITSVSKVIPWYNAKNFSVVLARHGIKFTPTTKVGECDEKLVSVLDMEFLKNTTIKKTGLFAAWIYFPVPAREMLYKTMSYNTSKYVSDEMLTYIICNDILSKVWACGEYQVWYDRFIPILQELGINEPMISPDEIRKRWRDGTLTSREMEDLFVVPFHVNVVKQMNKGTCATAAGDLNEEKKVTPDACAAATDVVVVGGATKPSRSLLNYDDVPSVCTILKRYFPFAKADVGEDAQLKLGLTPCTILSPRDLLSPIDTNPTLIVYYAQMYRLWAGNMRFQLILNDDETAPTSIAVNYAAGPFVNGPTWSLDSSLMDTGPTHHTSRVCAIQVPYRSRFPMSVVPWFEGEDVSEFCSNGSLSYLLGQTPSTHPPRKGCLHVAMGDASRFARFCRVPSLKITGSNFPHEAGTPVDVPEFFQFVHNDLDGYDIIGGRVIVDAAIPSLTDPATGGGDWNSFTVSQAVVSDSMLLKLGFVLVPGQSRNVLTGETFSYDVKNPTVTIQTIPQQFAAVKDSTALPPGGAWLFTGGASSPIYDVIDNKGLPAIISPNWTIGPDAYGDPGFLGLASAALSYTYTLGSYKLLNTDEPDLTIPAHASEVIGPYTAYRWSDGIPAAPKVLYFGDLTHRLRVKKQATSTPVAGGVVVESKGAKNGIESCDITLGERPVSNLESVHKEQFLGTFNWDPTDSAGTALQSFLSPFELVKSQVMASAFERYLYWRGNITIRIQLQSNEFQSGSLMLVWAPLMNKSQAHNVYDDNPVCQHCTEHVVLYAGRTQSMELTVPYAHPNNYLDLRSDRELNYLGCFMIYVMNPLRLGSGATSTSASFSVFVKFGCVDFQVLNPTSTHVITPPTTQAVRMRVRKQGGIQSSVKNINLAHALINGTVDAKSGSDSFMGGNTDLAPADKPNWAVQAAPVQPRCYPILTNVENVDYCVQLDTSAGSVPLVTPTNTGVTDDEISFKYLTQKLGFFRTFSFDTSSVQGDILDVYDLCPCSEYFYLAAGTTFTPSLLSHVTLPFSFWRGGLVYKLVFVATPMHTARIQICSHYGFEADGLDVNEALGQYTLTVDVRGVTEVTTVFPWRSPTEWKLVPNGSYLDGTPYSMGQFSIRVLNPLQSPETVSNTVDVNVFMCGAPDFRVAVVGTNAADITVVPS